jgi:hypothetical protein
MQQGLLKSIDGGNTLQPTGLPNAFVMNVVVSPAYATDRTLYVTTYQGIYKSTDAGNTWTFTNNLARMEQDRQGNFRNSGTFSVLPAALASTSKVNNFTAAGASTTVTFTGSTVTFIGATGPGLGLAAITLDGVPQGTVDLSSPIQQWQVPVWQKSGLACTLHTLTLTAAAAPSGNVGMMVDAIDYTRGACAH